jgi:uncharacterized membrane protein YtjA (UPF0391 family)
MIRASISFFILALVAYVFGAYGIAGLSIEIGKVLLGVFLVLSLITFLGGMISGRKQGRLN